MKNILAFFVNLCKLPEPTPFELPQAEVPVKKTVDSVLAEFTAVIDDLEEVAATAKAEQVETEALIASYTKRLGDLQNEQDKDTTVATKLKTLLA